MNKSKIPEVKLVIEFLKDSGYWFGTVHASRCPNIFCEEPPIEEWESCDICEDVGRYFTMASHHNNELPIVSVCPQCERLWNNSYKN